MILLAIIPLFILASLGFVAFAFANEPDKK